MNTSLNDSHTFPLPAFLDPDSGGLEQGAVQRHGLHLPHSCSLLHRAHDLWELCPVQPAGGHLGGGFPDRGTVFLGQVICVGGGFIRKNDV